MKTRALCSSETSYGVVDRPDMDGMRFVTRKHTEKMALEGLCNVVEIVVYLIGENGAFSSSREILLTSFVTG